MTGVDQTAIPADTTKSGHGRQSRRAFDRELVYSRITKIIQIAYQICVVQCNFGTRDEVSVRSGVFRLQQVISQSVAGVIGLDFSACDFM